MCHCHLYECRVLCGQFLKSFNLLNARLVRNSKVANNIKWNIKQAPWRFLKFCIAVQGTFFSQFALTHIKIWGCQHTGHLDILAFRPLVTNFAQFPILQEFYSSSVPAGT